MRLLFGEESDSVAKSEHDGECPAPVYLQQSPIDLGASYYHPLDVGQMSFAYPISRVKGVVEARVSMPR